MKIECRSFGFKNGADAHADFVLDVRCLPNPFYVEHLKHKTGLDKSVRDYVLNDETSREYLEKIIDMLMTAMAVKEKYGTEKLSVSFGCTGGHHRSVTFAIVVCDYLKQQGYDAYCVHRDIDKED